MIEQRQTITNYSKSAENQTKYCWVKFYDCKLILAIKESKMGFFEKNIYKNDISLGGLKTNNEIKKSFKPEEINKIKFDVIVRIHQAYSKKELQN